MRALTAALIALAACTAPAAGIAAAAVRYESAFTTLDPAQCSALAAAPGGSVRECPGQDGVRVRLAEEDVQRWLLLQAGHDETDLRVVITGTVQPDPTPHRVATPLEWRYRIDGARRELVALIIRVTGDAGAAPQRIVLRATPEGAFCVITAAVLTEAVAHEHADGPAVCHWTIHRRRTT